jgi:hypothetical protein
MHYQLTFTTEQAQALWQCVMQAPLPRYMTEELAAAFRSQVEAQNRAREAAAAAQANGHDQAQP